MPWAGYQSLSSLKQLVYSYQAASPVSIAVLAVLPERGLALFSKYVQYFGQRSQVPLQILKLLGGGSLKPAFHLFRVFFPSISVELHCSD